MKIQPVLKAAVWFLFALLFASWFAAVSQAPYVTDLPMVWRPNPDKPFVKFLYYFPNFGRPVDLLDTIGLSLFGFVGFILIPLLRLIDREPIPLWKFAESLVYFIGIAVIEDLAWYAVSPAWGLHRFRPENLPHWMYQAWFLGVPSQYWEAFFASFGIAILSVRLRRKKGRFRLIIREAAGLWAVAWGTMICCVLLTSQIANHFWIG
ncbi:MAG: hypothetical protein KGJ13_00095 [Patescibacteria group bacterium]|nr:hypothetical protein [Patescibacteria group bacterium]